MTKTIHFEGIAGAGKSTASERLYKILKERGIDAAWWLEESTNHPILPMELRASSTNSNFPKVCLDAWQSFSHTSTPAVSILDGYAFQSTVRFLWQQRACQGDIDGYFGEWQKLAPDTSITYFSVNNPVEHFEVVLQERGEDWTNKLFAWVERTPIGKARHWQGKSGFIEFWSRYQELCLELLTTAKVDIEIIESRSWDSRALEDLATRRGLF